MVEVGALIKRVKAPRNTVVQYIFVQIEIELCGLAATASKDFLNL